MHHSFVYPTPIFDISKLDKQLQKVCLTENKDTKEAMTNDNKVIDDDDV